MQSYWHNICLSKSYWHNVCLSKVLIKLLGYYAIGEGGGEGAGVGPCVHMM